MGRKISLRLWLNRTRIHIEEINYENKKVTIIDKDYFDHNKDKSCLRPSMITTLNFKLFVYCLERYRIEGDGKLTVLYNCSNPVEDHLNPLIKSLKCRSVSNQSRGYTYFTLPQYLEEVVMGWGCQVIEISIIKEYIPTLWQPGWFFGLEWCFGRGIRGHVVYDRPTGWMIHGATGVGPTIQCVITPHQQWWHINTQFCWLSIMYSTLMSDMLLLRLNLRIFDSIYGPSF